MLVSLVLSSSASSAVRFWRLMAGSPAVGWFDDVFVLSSVSPFGAFSEEAGFVLSSS